MAEEETPLRSQSQALPESVVLALVRGSDNRRKDGGELHRTGIPQPR
jgi:hypothetical protein